MGDFIGGVKFYRGNGASRSEAFNKIDGLTDISGIGQSNALIDATDYDSTAKEYIMGLPDGNEISLEFHDNLASGNTQLSWLIDDVKHKRKRNFRIALTDGTNTVTYNFAAVCISWEKSPSIDSNPNKVKVKIKVSGQITT